MSFIYDQEFFKFLQPKEDNHEIDLIATTLEVMSVNLRATNETAGAVFVALSQELQKSLQRHRESKFSFQDYFNGNGPIARKLKEHLAISDWLNRNDDQYFQQRMSILLEGFSYELSTNPHDLKAMDVFIRGLHPLIYKEPPDIYPAEPAPPVIDFARLETGFYHKEEYGKHPLYVLVLRGTLPITETEVILSALSNHQTNIYYHHPKERRWVMCDMSALLPGTLEVLSNQLRIAIRKNEAALQPKDWPVEIARFKAKADEVFANEQYLPSSIETYRRDTDVSSRITYTDAGYTVTFFSTKGAYPSQSVSFSKRVGIIDTVVAFDKLPESMKRRLLRCGEYHMDSLLQKIAETQKASSEVMH